MPACPAPTLPANGRLGVALGGGAARGYAHIGFLDALLDRSIRPARLSGSSIGALVGAVFAAGNWRKFKADALSLKLPEIVGLFKPFLPWKALFSPEPFIDFIIPYLRTDDLAQTDPPLAIVAADAFSGEEVILTTGSICDAVKASTALPGLFPPFALNGRLLFDGGLVQPVPVAALDRTACDFVVGVDLNAQVLPGQPPAKKSQLSLPRTLLHAGYVMMHTISRECYRNHPPDALVQPDLSSVGILDVHKGRQAYDAGWHSALELLGD